MSDKTNILNAASRKIHEKKGSQFDTAAMLTRAMMQQGLSKQQITEAMKTDQGMVD